MNATTMAATTATSTAAIHAAKAATAIETPQAPETAGLQCNVVDDLFEHRLGADESARPYLVLPERKVSFDDLHRRV
ncbi:MAG: hypothetical protein ACR2GP_16100, partial [Burkholderiaceae bacterium]